MSAASSPSSAGTTTHTTAGTTMRVRTSVRTGKGVPPMRGAVMQPIPAVVSWRASNR
ncbi:hypothetical protein [Actinacidiphila bryophytorum]|uniref:hypothetical protein n=1 Tax=Actinacidiphila bryophytorum TaxID=1436133 RepID=UPI002176C88F|nr:hypothetical protein [Actinacidiphila bryophytorum]UWE11387.1 hypothetical protein NYE86_23490 [Actinacidiphila bryophytorum]